MPTEQELRAVDKWEAERQASFKRTGYLSDWGRPYIAKWEERYQGRLWAACWARAADRRAAYLRLARHYRALLAGMAPAAAGV